MGTRAEQKDFTVALGNAALQASPPELVTPSDAADGYPARGYRALMISELGEVVVETPGGDAVNFPSGMLLAGVQYVMTIARVRATGDSGTTAAIRIIGFP